MQAEWSRRAARAAAMRLALCDREEEPESGAKAESEAGEETEMETDDAGSRKERRHEDDDS